ncbi:MAG TPA: PD-(D/E)XK nuclease family protein [Nevskia sp.]|nr:PD-(D/E)XK nuclease family protein [Nevskia sp.]
MDSWKFAEGGGTVIAATERVARELRIAYANERRGNGKKAWLAPRIYSFRSWVRRSWEASWPERQLLHPAQEHAAWLYVLEKSGAASGLLSRASAARQARLAAATAERYCVAIEPGAFATRDELAFAEWHRTFEELLVQRGWITEEKLPRGLLQLLESGVWIPEPQILLAGFLDETPIERLMFDALARAGVLLERASMPLPSPGHIEALRPGTRRVQFRQAACRARAALEAAQAAGAAPPRIGILVPDMAGSRDSLESALAEFVAPHTLTAGALRGRVPWRFGQAAPLARHPTVAAALDMLSLDSYRNSLELVSRILLAPATFCAHPNEAKSALDLRIRKAGSPRLSRAAIQAHCRAERERGGQAGAAFAAQFAGWLEGPPEPERALPSAWADWIESILKAADWGRHDLTGEQSQAVDAWRECLDAFRAMDGQLREIDRSRMVAWLREVVTGRGFQPSVDHVQPISILSNRDATGLSFDELIVLDMVGGNLPEPAKPVPFLPADALARAGVPGTRPEESLARAQRWLDHVVRMAPAVTLMAPARDDNGAVLQPTPLYTAWPSAPSEESGCQSHLEGIVRRGQQTEQPPEEWVPPIADAGAEDIRGGVSILKACRVSPWVGFARHRLGLTPFPQPQEGMTAALQGELVHRSLERIWGELRTQEELRRLPGLPDFVEAHVRAVQLTEGIGSPNGFGAGMAAVERERAVELLVDWLELEKRRALPFEVVACEGRTRAVLEGLALDLRVDRVDKILAADGSNRYLVIDYKSLARLDRAAWECDDEGIDEPQLPLYATFADLRMLGIPRIDGIAFAKVCEGATDFILASNFADRLVAEGGTTGSGVADWPAQVAQWARSLTGTTRGFVGGDLRLNRRRFSRDRFSADLDALVRKRASAAAASSDDPF